MEDDEEPCEAVLFQDTIDAALPNLQSGGGRLRQKVERMAVRVDGGRGIDFLPARIVPMTRENERFSMGMSRQTRHQLQQLSGQAGVIVLGDDFDRAAVSHDDHAVHRTT